MSFAFNAPAREERRPAGAPARVLVLGEDTRAFLAVVRSLGRRGCEVHAAPTDFASAALKSRYLKAVHRLPPYSLSPVAWVAALRELVDRHGFDLIVPCTDFTVIPLHHHRAEFAGTRLALPNAEAMAVFFDKDETRRAAAAAGVPVAKGRGLAASDSAEALAVEFGLPFALKPRTSYRLGQAGARAAVRIVAGIGQAAEALGEIRDRGEWLVESFFAGDGVGVSILAETGRVLQAFQHRRLHEASASGGSSSRISEPLDPRLLAAVEKLTRATGLEGVAMFEFRLNRQSGEFILLEVNARFWGSLPLALAARADFPALLLDQTLGHPVAGRVPYKAGVVRKALTSEYHRLIKDSEARALPARLATLGFGLGRLALSLGSGRAYDSWAADDPAPWHAERAELVRWIARAAAKRLPPGRPRRGAARAVERLAAAAKAGRGRVVMLCHGNICRSPFAEQLLRAKARDAGLSLDVVSAGTIAREGRASPEDALAAARAHGADLAGHRSAYLTAEAARAADAIVVFDQRNVDELRRIGVNGEANVLRLADLAGTREIADPYGQGPDGFAEAYAQIERGVDRLVAELLAAGARP